MAVDVLDHHDRIVHQDADRKYQRKQRHPVEGETPGPGRKQRDSEGQDHRTADDGRLALAERKKHQRHHRRGGKQQLGDQLLRLVVCRGAVVARFGHLHIARDHGIAQRLDPLHHRIGHVDGVFAGLLGDRNRHRRVFGHVSALLAGHAVPDVAAGRQRTVAHRGHVAQENWLAGTHTHHQVGHLAGLAQERPGLDGHRAVAMNQLTDRQTKVGGQQRLAQVGHRHADA